MRYTKKQIKVMRARLQEYVDLGWNGKRASIKIPCPLCLAMNCWCEKCPLYGCSEKTIYRRRGLAMYADRLSQRRTAARAHAYWLVRRYNAADEGGEWSIE
jgi:hypothetical protein